MLKTVVGLQSLAIVGRAVKLVPTNIKVTPKQASKKLVKGFFNISVATALIGPTSEIVNKL